MYYVAYYTLPDDKRKSSPAANAKIPTIAKALAAQGESVTILSTCTVVKDDAKGFVKGRKFNVDQGVDCLQFSTFAAKKGFVRRLLYWRANIKLFFKLLKVKKGQPVCFYHAIERISVIRLAKKIKKFKLILEVEEIYANASKLSKKEIANEKEIFNLADAYIFSTELLNQQLNTENKPYVIIYGTYKAEERIADKINDGRIHCVYAGTLNKLKGGCFAAVEAAEFLDEKYHIHIIGFGEKSEQEELNQKILDISKKTKCLITFDGLKTGSEYIKFIQSCHIGLSTQDPNKVFNSTSFPSKILSYMSNGLQVVSAKIEVLERSKISDMINYYCVQNARSIAEAIKSISFDSTYEPQEYILELNKTFINDTIKMLRILK